jgi:tRNA(Ile)-lysidine synthase
MATPTLDQSTAPRPGRHAAIFRRVQKYIAKSGCIQPGEKLVVAVSGGADSTALALILSHARPTRALNFVLAHFNHHLRTDEDAKSDREFVELLAHNLGASVFHGEYDVRQYATENRLSLEDAARRVRYAFLREQADATGATAIALGHTGTDQAETVLFRIIRGTGVEGLRAMVSRAPWPLAGTGPDLVRPLLSIQRDDTELYCRGLGITPRDDSSNRELTATRNRIRHQVLPLLRELNPRIDAGLVALAQNAEGYASFLDRQAEAVWPNIAHEATDQVIFARDRFDELHIALRARLLIRAYRKLTQNTGEITNEQVTQALSSRSKRDWRLSLPGGVHLRVGVHDIRLVRGEEPPIPSIQGTPLSVPGRTEVGAWLIETSLGTAPPVIAMRNPFEACLDADVAGTDLNVRSRCPGDRLRPLGLGGEKKLQDILVDAKVPARERDGVPLVCSGDQIAWVVGHCIDERFALTPASSRALHLNAIEKK